MEHKHFDVLEEIIKARIEKKLSQRELAKKAKTTQAVLSRIENMTVSPSIQLVQRIAEAMGKKLEIKFILIFHYSWKINQKFFHKMPRYILFKIFTA